MPEPLPGAGLDDDFGAEGDEFLDGFGRRRDARFIGVGFGGNGDTHEQLHIGPRRRRGSAGESVAARTHDRRLMGLQRVKKGRAAYERNASAAGVRGRIVPDFSRRRCFLSFVDIRSLQSVLAYAGLFPKTVPGPNAANWYKVARRDFAVDLFGEQ